MNKMQKTWFGFGLILFLVPELIWGSVFGLWSWGKEFVSNADNHGPLTVIILLQFIGLMLAGVSLLFRKNLLIKTCGVLLILVSLWPLYLFYLLFATLHLWS